MHFRIDQDPTLVTRTRYEFLATANAAARGIDDDVLHGRGLAGYDVFAGACPDQLDKDPLKDLDKLANATAVVKTYTDERIAHIGHAANVGALTFGDLDRGIDAVGDPGAQALPGCAIQETRFGTSLPNYQRHGSPPLSMPGGHLTSSGSKREAWGRT
jgi:hypothetical protein